MKPSRQPSQDPRPPADPAAEPWYRQAFQADYLDIYLHRDLAEAVRAVAFLTEALHLSREHRLLDLCCGPGRHLVFLRERVGRAVGLDLSPTLLDRAREHWKAADGASAPRGPQHAPPLVRADMRRLPLATGSFDRVVNLFTSFGYFESEADNQVVLMEIGRILKGAGADGLGGMLALDHINRQAMLAGFRPQTARTLDNGRRVVEKRNWDEPAGRVTKDVVCVEPDGQVRAWRESVRVYRPDELEEMLDRAGLAPLDRRGDYDGAAWRPDSPRLILIARKKPD